MRPLAGRVLGYETSMREHPVIQRPIRRGIDDAESVAEHADRAATGIERGRVDERIDAAGHAADDDGALRHRTREDSRRLGAVGRVVAATHEGDAGSRQQRRVAPDVEDDRWIADFLELRREIGRAGQQDLGIERHQPFEHANAVVRARRLDGRRRCLAEPGDQGDPAVRRVERGARAAECPDQVAQALRSDARNERQRQCGYDFSVFHRTSKSSGMPWRATAEIVTTGAPASVRMGTDRFVGWLTPGCQPGVNTPRSDFVRTTTCGLAASSFEYEAASRRSSSYVACGSGLSTGTSTATARVRSTCWRKRRPSPFPSCAPSMMPGMSATTNERLSDSPTTPRCGSSVVNG